MTLADIGAVQVTDLGRLGQAGLGSIGPAPGDDVARYHRLVDALAAGVGFACLTPKGYLGDQAAFITGDCIDGRPLADEPGPAAARAAGGTLALLAGLWGLDDQFGPLDGPDLADGLVALDLPVWVHQGCGANEHLAQVADYLMAHRAELDDLRHRLGLGTAPGDRTAQAARLANRLDGTSPADRQAGLARTDQPLPRFDGDHAELAVIVNLVRPVTLDRMALAEATESAQVFTIDAWALADSAAAALTATDGDPSRRDDLADLLLDLNLAAVGVLANQYVGLIVVRPGEAPPGRR